MAKHTEARPLAALTSAVAAAGRTHRVLGQGAAPQCRRPVCLDYVVKWACLLCRQPSTSGRAPWQRWEQLWRRPRDDAWRMHREECFPTALHAHGGGLTGGGGTCQSLVSVGSRQWGHPAISSLLRVKIYDFAVYIDGAKVLPVPAPLMWHVLQHSCLA